MDVKSAYIREITAHYAKLDSSFISIDVLNSAQTDSKMNQGNVCRVRLFVSLVMSLTKPDSVCLNLLNARGVTFSIYKWINVYQSQAFIYLLHLFTQPHSGRLLFLEPATAINLQKKF